MKRATGFTLIFISSHRIARADFANDLHTFNATSRPAGASLTDAVRTALSLGGKAVGTVWVLSENVWTQKVSLSPAQVAGLSPEQLGRALSFEVEPFSGIPITEGVIGFQHDGTGSFTVVEMSRTDRDAIQRAVESSGGKLTGIAHASQAPEDEASLREWLRDWESRRKTAGVPIIEPPAPTPSPNRFLATGIALEAAALLILFASGGWMATQRRALERNDPGVAAANRELDATNKQIAALKDELAILEKEQGQRERVHTRRGALLAVLKGLAATRPEDVVVRSIQAEGPSSLVVSGISLEAGAVDEMSIVLSQRLRAAGWTAQPRQKTGRRSLSTGGPWEFSLALTHDEAEHPQPMRLSQRREE